MDMFPGSVASNESFYRMAAVWWGYAPLGIIGAWRWSVWCFKKIIALFYRPPNGRYDATLSVVVPVYNEDPDMFRLALLSWKNNDPEEIIAVIDATDTACIEVFESFMRTCPKAKMIVTHTPGKRAALAEGIKASSGEIVALTDSDTLWTKDLKRKSVDPFQDPKVGGVAPRQDVLMPDTIARRLFRIHIFNRYGNDLVYQAAFGNALSCISGRTGVYRRSAIEHLTDDLVHERFLGKPCISGDDKRLTSLIQRDGWAVKYVRDALVYTSGSPDMKTYTKQQVRWIRNSWRADLQSVFTRWLWRNPFLAFHTVDRFIQPFALLLGPMFFVIAVMRGDRAVAAILACWWMISRSVKILPHLRRHPRDIWLMPIHVAYTFFLAVIKIYTLLTVNEQTWITRWDASRLKRSSGWRRGFAYAATCCIVSSLFLFSYTTNNHAVSRAQVAQRKAQAAQEKLQRKLFKTDGQSVLTSIGEQDAAARMNALSEKTGADAFGYYRMRPGETLAGVRRRFFLRQDAKIFSENKVAFRPTSVVNVGTRVAIAVDDLRNPDRERYRNARSSSFTVTDYPKQNAIRITGKGSFVTVTELAAKMNDASAIENLGNKEFMVRKNIFIDDGVTLIIDGADVSWLKLRSGPGGFVWVKSENGNIVINGTKVTSWDESKGGYDTDWQDGRSYILEKLSGRMDIYDSELAYLGNFGVPDRGNPYGGPYGVSWKISNGSFRNELSTGMIVRSHIHHNVFGAYTFGATGIVFSDSVFSDNIGYGIDPHDDSNHLLIESNKVFRNGNHGIIISKRCFSNIIRGNLSQDNRLHGIMLDRDSDHNIVEGNYVVGNVNGIVVNHSSENLIERNSLSGNLFGIRANNRSISNFFGGNIIEKSRKGVYIYQDSPDNYVFRNRFLRDDINIHLKERSSAFYLPSDHQEILRAKESGLSFLDTLF